MKGINKTHHLGTVIAPKMTYTPDSLAVLEFTLGVREKTEHTPTAYITSKLFGKYAETLEPHLKEGRVVETFGSLHQVIYKAKGSDTERTDTSVTVHDLLLLQGEFEYWQDRKEQTLLSGGLNEVTVSGNLTHAAAIHQTKTGEMTKARIAVKDKDDALFIDVTLWNALELTKGQGVSITGRLLSDSYLNKTKKRVYTTFLEATRIDKLAKLVQD
jgi:single-strand DNA-binding protein